MWVRQGVLVHVYVCILNSLPRVWEHELVWVNWEDGERQTSLISSLSHLSRSLFCLHLTSRCRAWPRTGGLWVFVRMQWCRCQIGLYRLCINIQHNRDVSGRLLWLLNILKLRGQSACAAVYLTCCENTFMCHQVDQKKKINTVWKERRLSSILFLIWHRVSITSYHDRRSCDNMTTDVTRRHFLHVWVSDRTLTSLKTGNGLKSGVLFSRRPARSRQTWRARVCSQVRIVRCSHVDSWFVNKSWCWLSQKTG